MTRVGDVKPLMEVACYTCDACGFEIYQEVTGDTFMPIQRCPTSACLNNAAGAQLHLQTRACKARGTRVLAPWQDGRPLMLQRSLALGSL